MAVDIRALLIKAVRMIDTSSQAGFLLLLLAPVRVGKRSYPQGKLELPHCYSKDTDITTNF